MRSGAGGRAPKRPFQGFIGRASPQSVGRRRHALKLCVKLNSALQRARLYPGLVVAFAVTVGSGVWQSFTPQNAFCVRSRPPSTPAPAPNYRGNVIRHLSPTLYRILHPATEDCAFGVSAVEDVIYVHGQHGLFPKVRFQIARSSRVLSDSGLAIPQKHQISRLHR